MSMIFLREQKNISQHTIYRFGEWRSAVNKTIILT